MPWSRTLSARSRTLSARPKTRGSQLSPSIPPGKSRCGTVPYVHTSTACAVPTAVRQGDGLRPCRHGCELRCCASPTHIYGEVRQSAVSHMTLRHAATLAVATNSSCCTVVALAARGSRCRPLGCRTNHHRRCSSPPRLPPRSRRRRRRCPLVLTRPRRRTCCGCRSASGRRRRASPRGQRRAGWRARRRRRRSEGSQCSRASLVRGLQRRRRQRRRCRARTPARRA